MLRFTEQGDKLVEELGLSGECRTSNVPMTKDFLIIAKDVDDGVAGVALESGNQYCSLVGSLLYVVNTTRPDIASAAGILSRFRETPTTSFLECSYTSSQVPEGY
jgi:hypothetical protein